MRFIQALVILPALAAAQEQVPLADRVQGWFNKAKSYLPTATPVVPTVAKVVEQKVQQQKAATVNVTPFNTSNWQSILEPSSEPQDWLVYVTGGNKTCFGRCENADKAFNVRTSDRGSGRCEHRKKIRLIMFT
jgi:PTH2 family peptidyl-tRNA hydrolase